MNPGIRFASTALVLGALSAGAWAGGPSLIEQGDRQWADGKVNDARKSFEQAAAADPKSPAPLLKLGGLHLTSNDPVAAIRTYQRVISLDINNARAWIGLGLAYLHTGQKDLSRAAFSEAIRSDPSRRAQLASLADTK